MIISSYHVIITRKKAPKRPASNSISIVVELPNRLYIPSQRAIKVVEAEIPL